HARSLTSAIKPASVDHSRAETAPLQFAPRAETEGGRTISNQNHSIVLRFGMVSLTQRRRRGYRAPDGFSPRRCRPSPCSRRSAQRSRPRRMQGLPRPISEVANGPERLRGQGREREEWVTLFPLLT